MATQSYPGNPSLPPETRQRVIATFRQSADLYRAGNREDAMAGCDFMLKLDPLFDPAKRLMEKINNPASAVDVDALVASVAGSDILQQARAALEARDFARALDLTSEILRSDFTNLEAQQVAEEAQGKLEAEPFIDQFVRSATAKLANGNVAAAEADLQKARQLDPDHPRVRALAAQVSAGSSSSPFASPQGFDAPASNPFAATDDAFGSPAGGGDASFDIGGGGFASPFSSGFSSPDPFAASQPEPAFGGAAPDATESASGFGAPSFGEGFGDAAPAAPAASDGAFGDPFAAPASPSSSFVVDTPAGGGGAQASDFGFTFEEDQPAAGGGSNFGFDSSAFNSPRAVGQGDTFDFATAAVETSPDDQEKIARYLSEGDAAFDAGDYQRAIDTWSKIFLIDVTNDDASNRIEKARAKRQELDRRIEELVVGGTLAFEKRDYASARSKFEEVLSLDPGHFNARQYLEQIESGAPTEAGPMATPMAPSADFFDDDGPTLKEAPLVPPDPSAAPAPRPKAATAAAPAAKGAPKAAARKLPVIPIAVALVVVLAVAGWFVFGRGGGSAAGDPAATQQVFAKAERLAQQNKFDEAIKLLSGVAPDDPQHDRALGMISDLREKKAQAAGRINGRPAAQVFAEYINSGRQAFASNDYVAAKDFFEKASAIQSLPPDVKNMYDAATQQVAKLESAVVLLREGKYEEGIANLQSLRQQDPQNESTKQLLAKAHFNYGVAYLQQENTEAALAEFDKVLELNPNDADAKRSRELAARYNGQAKDLLYRIYVKYLPARTF